MTKYFTEEERREAKKKKSRRQRERRAEREGRVLREYAQYHTDGLAKERKVMGQRYARALKAMEEGRAFRPRSLCDAHVKAFEAHRPELIGPPKPTETTIGVAAYRRFRYWASISYRENELSKRRRYRESLHDAYIASQLNMKLREIPNELLEIKREQLKCSRVLREFLSTIKDVENDNA
jgi:hypothetical protein